MVGYLGDGDEYKASEEALGYVCSFEIFAERTKHTSNN